MRGTSLLLAGLLLISFSGCGKSETQAQAQAPAPSAEMVWPDGWQRVEIFANYAHTTLGNAAHFNTDRNRCFLAAYGSLQLDAWNKTADMINKVMNSTRLPEEKCVDLPQDQSYNTGFKFDGTADIVKQDGTKIMLFEYRNWSVCSLISDRAMHERLLAAINEVVLAADQEDCPQPRGGY